MAPIANDKWAPKTKTYADTAPDETGTGSGNTGKPKQLQDGSDEESQPINKDGDAGAGSTGSDSGTNSRSPASSKGSKKGPGAGKIEEDGQGAGNPPTINIGEKVAWRSAPTRTRIGTQPHAVTARLVRLPVYPQSDWLPVESESKVANRK